MGATLIQTTTVLFSPAFTFSSSLLWCSLGLGGSAVHDLWLFCGCFHPDNSHLKLLFLEVVNIFFFTLQDKLERIYRPLTSLGTRETCSGYGLRRHGLVHCWCRQESAAKFWSHSMAQLLWSPGQISAAIMSFCCLVLQASRVWVQNKVDESKHEIHSQVDAITAGTASVVNLTAGKSLGDLHWRVCVCICVHIHSFSAATDCYTVRRQSIFTHLAWLSICSKWSKRNKCKEHCIPSCWYRASFKSAHLVSIVHQCVDIFQSLWGRFILWRA